MPVELRTVEASRAEGRRVLVRDDFNVPLDDSGRVADVAGEEAAGAAAGLGPGRVLLLQNLRFEPGEEANDPAFAGRLAALAELYVDDAFGAAHRAHASVVGVAERLPAYAGFLLAGEVKALSRLLEGPPSPFVAVLGGSKVSDKLAVLSNLLQRVDTLVIGGGMCFTFLAARGHGVGNSLLEPEQVDAVRGLLARAEREGKRVLLPSDVVVADAFAEDAERRTVPASGIEQGWRGLDIGPETAAAFATAVRDAKTVFWNGPMGVFEWAPFAAGTREVAEAVASTGAYTVV